MQSLWERLRERFGRSSGANPPNQQQTVDEHSAVGSKSQASGDESHSGGHNRQRPEDFRSLNEGRGFYDQLKYEDEGATAALNGLNRNDNPYPAKSFEWNHWLYGHDIARGEQQAFDDGFITVSSTAMNDMGTKMNLESAMESGIFKPRYVTIKSS